SDRLALFSPSHTMAAAGRGSTIGCQQVSSKASRRRSNFVRRRVSCCAVASEAPEGDYVCIKQAPTHSEPQPRLEARTGGSRPAGPRHLLGPSGCAAWLGRRSLVG